MSVKQSYITRLEADLEELKLERRIAEMGRGAGDEAVVRRLRNRERYLREILQRARSAPDDGWQSTKAELQDAWHALMEALTESDRAQR